MDKLKFNFEDVQALGLGTAYAVGLIDFETKSIQLKKSKSGSNMSTTLGKLTSNSNTRAAFLYNIVVSEKEEYLSIICFESEFISISSVTSNLKESNYIFVPVRYQRVTDSYQSQYFNSLAAATQAKDEILEKYPKMLIDINQLKFFGFKRNKWYLEVDTPDYIEDINHLRFKRYFLPRSQWSVEEFLSEPEYTRDEVLLDKHMPNNSKNDVSDDKWWDLIESIGWGSKSVDYELLSKDLYSRLGREEVDLLHEFVGQKQDELQQVLDKWEESNVQDEIFGDDSYRYLTAHIVGLGKEFYMDIISHPEKAFKVKYVESFSYVFLERD